MEKDISLKIEFLSTEEDDRCRINSAKEIASILHSIAKNRSRIALYYGNEYEFILTTALHLDSTGLYLEQSPYNRENQRIIESNKLVFVGSHTQVKIQFPVSHINSVVYLNQPAFNIPLPNSIYRLQRREYYRLAPPPGAPLRCNLASEDLSAKRLRELTIVDISGGGIGLTYAETDNSFSVGDIYYCQIDLPDTGMIKGRIEIKSLASLTSSSGQPYKYAGCEFKNLDGQSAPLLQRYVTDVQRAAKSKLNQ